MLSKTVIDEGQYLRATFSGGNFDTMSTEIQRHLLGVYYDALVVYEKRRILLVVDASRYDEYPLVDLACLSAFINAVFHNMSIAYLNLQSPQNDTRRAFFRTHRAISNGMTFEMFNDEKVALEWLLRQQRETL